MNILAIDSASPALSAAVFCEGVYFYKEDNSAAHKSDSCPLIVDDVMKEAGLKPNKLNGVICMEGPGSFTGLRIGYSIAKGLALALSIPFTAVPTLDCIAYPDKSFAAIETGKNAYYYAYYKNGTRQSDIFDSSVNPPEIPCGITIEKRGYARELLYLAIERNLFTCDNANILYEGPKYLKGVV